mgnify:CR=1 FL=1
MGIIRVRMFKSLEELRKKFLPLREIPEIVESKNSADVEWGILKYKREKLRELVNLKKKIEEGLWVGGRLCLKDLVVYSYEARKCRKCGSDLIPIDEEIVRGISR